MNWGRSAGDVTEDVDDSHQEGKSGKRPSVGYFDVYVHMHVRTHARTHAYVNLVRTVGLGKAVVFLNLFTRVDFVTNKIYNVAHLVTYVEDERQNVSTF